MLAVRDTILRHPQASLVLLFVGAFTAFALSGDKPRRKKKPSLFKRVVSFFLEDKPGFRSESRSRKLPKETTSGIMVLLEDAAIEHIFMRPSPVQLESETSFESIIEQLRAELNEERESRLRLRDTVKREQALRIEAEEGMRLVEEALKLEKQKTKKLKQGIRKAKAADQRLHEEQAKIRDLETRLASEKARADRLEREAAKLRAHQNGVRNEEDEYEDADDPRTALTNSGKKRVFTII